MFRFVKPIYNREKLSQTWSEDSYDKYKDAEHTWEWWQFPEFNDRNSMFTPPNGAINGSILEIGCACGAAFNFLRNRNGFADITQYNGLDISDKGIEYCQKNYKGPKWVQADLTRHKFEDTFDYGFERIAIHHMPDPLAIFEKVLGVINKSFSTTFVSCIDGDTISDLNIARYRHAAGEFYYFNIINVFEVIELMLENGFNKIMIIYHGPHEPVYADPLAHQYFSPEINFNKRMVGRTSLIAVKTGGPSDVSLVFNPDPVATIKKNIKFCIASLHLNQMFMEHRKHVLVMKERIPRFIKRQSGVDYPSAYSGHK